MEDRELRALVEAQSDWMIQMRRKLHRIPENGFAEHKTQKVIMDALDEMGIPYTTERTWVIGLIEGKLPGGVAALRADMDALPLEEPEGCEFRSEHPGMMHACGHDAHMAMVLGAAKVLSGMKDRLHGTVKLLFSRRRKQTAAPSRWWLRVQWRTRTWIAYTACMCSRICRWARLKHAWAR